MNTCRTCKHLDVKPDTRGRITPRSGWAYQCVFPLPPQPMLPSSVTESPLYRDTFPRSFMTPDRGARCPVWESRK